MAYTFYFLVCVVFHVTIVQIGGQDLCAPGPVEDIILYDDHTLSWSPSPNEKCVVDHYLVNILSQTDWEQRIFLTDQTHMDVGYLPKCEMVSIVVWAVSSDNVEGVRTSLVTKTSAPKEANIDLTFIRLYQYQKDVLGLEWDVAEEWSMCVRQYRIVYYNEDDDDIFFTVYVPYAYAFVRDIIPCTSYVFTVTAIHSLEEEGRPSVLRYFAPNEKLTPPTLQRLTSGSTTADLTWTFPVPTVNRCPITALIVDGSPYFNISYPISGQNQLTRPPLNVHLTGLLPGTMYILRVSANNSLGFSEPFIVGVQTLEQ